MIRMRFEYYVLNYNFNKHEIVSYNIFNNSLVQKDVEKAVREYLKNPNYYTYYDFCKEETYYGFDGLCEAIKTAIKSEEWCRCEYEIAVGSIHSRDLNELEKDNFSLTDLKNRIILEVNSYVIELTGRRPIIIPMILSTKK